MTMKMEKIRINIVLSLCAIFVLGGCTQNTKSAMNTSPVEIKKQTVMEQIPVGQITDGVLSALANDYSRLGAGPLELTMAFDPKSKTFTAMSALNKLKEIKMKLARKGVKAVVTETLAIDNAKPALMISFDSVHAQAPSDCDVLPSITQNQTTRFLGEYKFGCSIETMLSKQIARPADLEGVDGLGDTGSGRRETNVIEPYAAGVPREPLEGIGRSDLGTD